MTSQTHKVATDALETLGTLPIPDNSGRDAIHLAVEPVIAGVRLRPGERVKIEEGFAVPAGHDAAGIVDPFLDGLVQSGQRFWFVVLPRTITSLRHVWSHPAFPEEASYHADADEHYVSDSKGESKAWLESFADRLFSYAPPEEYGSALDQLIAGIEHDGYFGTDIEYGDDTQPSAELYMHYERFTGKPAPKQPEGFRCAC